MNIQRVLKSPFTPKALSSLRQRIFERIPNITVNKEALFCDIGRVLGRPDVGRGIMGITAIMTQPLIDYYNPKVDRDTAKVSTCRTIGKILAGTAVGCVVRSLCYHGTKVFTNMSQNAPKWRKLLLPSDNMVQLLNARDADWIKNHRSTLANLIGLGVMLGTNVLLDVPLTNLISKTLIKWFNPSKQTNTETQDTENSVITNSETRDVKEKFNEVFIDKFNNRNRWRAGQ